MIEETVQSQKNSLGSLIILINSHASFFYVSFWQ